MEKSKQQYMKYVKKLDSKLQCLIAYVEENNRKTTQKDLNLQFQKLKQLQ